MQHMYLVTTQSKTDLNCFLGCLDYMWTSIFNLPAKYKPRKTSDVPTDGGCTQC